MIWIILILLIFVMSYREVQILIDRGSWKAIDHFNIFWYTEWDEYWKLWDSFHVSNGIVIMIICLLFLQYVVKFKIEVLGKYQTVALLLPLWFAVMQLRNLFMEIL